VYEVTGNTAIVLFHSNGNIPGKGFLLSFSVVVDLPRPMYSENHILNVTNNNESINYVRDDYSNNELTTLLHVGTPFETTLQSKYLGYLGPNCITDYILVRKLRSTPLDWVEADR